MSRSQLVQARPLNLFNALNNFQERVLSQFYERELFNPDNDFQLNERVLQYVGDDHHDLDQNERSIEDDDDDEEQLAIIDDNADSISKQVFNEKGKHNGQFIDRT